MKVKNNLSFLIILIACSQSICSQDSISLHFSLEFHEKKIQLNTEYAWEDQPILFTKLKFYISNVSYYLQDELISIDSTAHLVDYSNSASLHIKLPAPTHFDVLEMGIGVDSLKNISAAMEGDLDPVHGMYWTWQSGFINFKLEGTSPKCPNRKNEFLYHIGGYEQPYGTFRKKSFRPKSQREMALFISMDKFMDLIDLKQINQVMSPGEKALIVADALPQILQIQND